MNFAFRNLLLSVAILLPGCAGPKAAPHSLRTELQRLERVDVNPDHYPSYSDYHVRVYRQVQGIVGRVSSASDLKTLFLECTRLLKARPDSPQERLIWIDAHDEAKKAIVFRLAELDSEEATKVLIDMFTDDSLGFDGESALNACNAISRCGQRALPHLAKINSEAHYWAVIQQVIKCIERGELYGP